MKYIIGCDAEAKLIEKKSSFIGQAFYVQSEEEAKEKLNAVKKKHYDARHNCFAYILDGGKEKMSDDGEPQGTAGSPILEVIRSKELSRVLVVVTRYFGGILLGAGGLTRAYSKAAAMALDEAGKKSVIIAKVLQIKCSYANWDKIRSFLERASVPIVDTQFFSDVIAKIAVSEGEENLKTQIRDMSLGEAEISYAGTQEIIV